MSANEDTKRFAKVARPLDGIPGWLGGTHSGVYDKETGQVHEVVTRDGQRAKYNTLPSLDVFARGKNVVEQQPYSHQLPDHQVKENLSALKSEIDSGNVPYDPKGNNGVCCHHGSEWALTGVPQSPESEVLSGGLEVLRALKSIDDNDRPSGAFSSFG